MASDQEKQAKQHKQFALQMSMMLGGGNGGWKEKSQGLKKVNNCGGLTKTATTMVVWT